MFLYVIIFINKLLPYKEINKIRFINGKKNYLFIELLKFNLGQKSLQLDSSLFK